PHRHYAVPRAYVQQPPGSELHRRTQKYRVKEEAVESPPDPTEHRLLLEEHHMPLTLWFNDHGGGPAQQSLGIVRPGEAGPVEVAFEGEYSHVGTVPGRSEEPSAVHQDSEPRTLVAVREPVCTVELYVEVSAGHGCGGVACTRADDGQE